MSLSQYFHHQYFRAGWPAELAMKIKCIRNMLLIEMSIHNKHLIVKRLFLGLV